MKYCKEALCYSKLELLDVDVQVKNNENITEPINANWRKNNNLKISTLIVLKYSWFITSTLPIEFPYAIMQLSFPRSQKASYL